ncbi:MAG: site-specific recombinase [Flavobacteriales bacterium]|nr:site-specific recombinase [Flavobacteriales bacterium]
MRRGEVKERLIAAARYPGQEVDALAQLVQSLRPTAAELAAGEHARLQELLTLLEADVEVRRGLSAYLGRLLNGVGFHRTLTDAGLANGGFWTELRQRVGYKVLPPQPDPRTSDHVLVNVFFREQDAKWVAELPDALCLRLLQLLELDTVGPAAEHRANELLFAAQVLGLRIAGMAFEPDVLRMVPEQEHLRNPFLLLAEDLDEHILLMRAAGTGAPSDHLLGLLAQCRAVIDQAYGNARDHGMGMRVNQTLMRMQRLLERLEVVLAILAEAERAPAVAQVTLLKQLVKYSAGSTNVSGYLNASTQVMAREVMGHTGRKGEHYITTTRSEYGAMFRSALGGGALVALACLLKALASKADVSPFGHAVLYSLNYAWAFIGIYLLHLTLATKQPAMTASTIAAALDQGRTSADPVGYSALADLVARVWRSQFVAFVGNVLMAFPVAMVIGLGWNALFGPELLHHKAPKLLSELDPLRSLAVPHAALAGVFLFLSGLIAGSVANNTIHLRIPQRIEAHPVLKLVLSEARRKRLAGFYERHASGIISNFWFAVFMGSVGVVGGFFGLPLDIRHITFAAGNLALGMVGVGPSISGWTIAICVLGIGLIGLFNFLVSFGLSLVLALRSRGLGIRTVVPMLRAILVHFRQAPLQFFFPPRG